MWGHYTVFNGRSNLPKQNFCQLIKNQAIHEGRERGRKEGKKGTKGGRKSEGRDMETEQKKEGWRR